jgi:hypothetical protein
MKTFQEWLELKEAVPGQGAAPGIMPAMTQPAQTQSGGARGQIQTVYTWLYNQTANVSNQKPLLEGLRVAAEGINPKMSGNELATFNTAANTLGVNPL